MQCWDASASHGSLYWPGEQPGGGVGQLVIGARVFEMKAWGVSLVGLMKFAQFSTTDAWQEPGAPPQSASVEHWSYKEAEQVCAP